MCLKHASHHVPVAAVALDISFRTFRRSKTGYYTGVRCVISGGLENEVPGNINILLRGLEHI